MNDPVILGAPEERLFSSGPLSRHCAFALIVCGTIGVREITRLIEKLKVDLEIANEVPDGDKI